MAQAAKKMEITFDDMINISAKPKTAKGKTKSKVPVLEAPLEIRREVDRYIEAKKAETMAKAEKDDAGENIIAFVRPTQDKDGYSGEFKHSYAVPGTDKNQVKFVSSNRYSINAEDEEHLAELLGQAFDGLIDKQFEVTLKPEVFGDENLKQELMSLVGARFGAFFDTKVALKVKEKFDERLYHTVKEKDLPVLRTFARPYKPSLR